MPVLNTASRNILCTSAGSNTCAVYAPVISVVCAEKEHILLRRLRNNFAKGLFHQFWCDFVPSVDGPFNHGTTPVSWVVIGVLVAQPLRSKLGFKGAHDPDVQWLARRGRVRRKEVEGGLQFSFNSRNALRADVSAKIVHNKDRTSRHTPSKVRQLQSDLCCILSG